MQAWLTGLAVSAFIGYVAGHIVTWWKLNRATVEEKLLTVDDWIEKKTNWNIPDSWQSWYHGQVHGAVSYVDVEFGDAKTTRQLLRKVVTMFDPTKRDAVVAEIEALILKFGENWAQQLEAATPDLKTLVNETKLEIAHRIVSAKVATAKAPSDTTPLPDSSQILADIKAAAPATIADHSNEPVTPELLARLVEESKARQQSLGKK